MKHRSITQLTALAVVLLVSAAYLGLGAGPAAADSDPLASRTPSSIDFGSQQAGTTSAPRIITVTAESDGSEAICDETWKPPCQTFPVGTSISNLTIGGTDAAAFSIASEDCTAREELRKGQTCSIAVTFSPAAVGSYSATLSINSNSVWSTGNQVQLRGNAPPPNDTFASGQTIGSAGGSVNGTTAGATREPGEPDHYTPVPGDADWVGEHSVWYRWTAPSSGSTTIDTCQANIDSVLAVYTGTQLDALSRVADNNNDHTFCPSGSWGSRVTFDAQAGTIYHIAVADAGGARESTFTLRVIDNAPPRVTSTTPANNATGVSPSANVRAVFSEPMQGSSVNTASFRLKKAGTTTFLGATVTYDPATKKATLDPNSNLSSGVTYVATVTSGARDQAGNSLDQNASLSGNQNKT